ncbi:hypothetical protein [Photobacterium leiognathi]|uniref:hypothetical protein n=1 Tax=Photobacterium leiognathi TaxID=553611 RepID=UPI0029810411|nr:hypothetical protein [Photobacterium leiognathi]
MMKLRSKTLSRSPKRQVGMGLPTLLMGIVIIGAMTAKGIEMYNGWKLENDVDTVVESSRKVGQGLDAYKRQWKHFNGFANSDVWNSPQLYTESLRSPVADQFNTVFSDNGIQYAPVTSVTNRAGKNFTSPTAKPMWVQQSYSGITTGACYMAVDKLIGEALQISLNGTRIHDNATKKSECDKAGDTTGATLQIVM